MKELIKKIKPIYILWQKNKEKITSFKVWSKYHWQKVKWKMLDLGHVYTRMFMYDIVIDIENAKNISDIAHAYYSLRFLEQKISDSNEIYISYDKRRRIFYGNLNYLADCIINNSDVINVARQKCKNYTRIAAGDNQEEIKYLKANMLRLKLKEKHVFGGAGRFYQSYEPLGIPGSRDTAFRIKTYQLDNYLNKNMDVLNIGCNCGFIDCTIAGQVKSITGIEYDAYFLQFANELKEIEGIQNITFMAGDFKTINLQRKFDMICSFAVHKWIGLPLEEYFSRLYNMLNERGIVLFETHGIDTYDKDIEGVLESVIQDKFEVISSGDIDDGFKRPRKFYYFRKMA